MNFVLGFIAALICLAGGAAIILPRSGKMFFIRDRSRLSFEDTLENIRKNVDLNSRGWFIESEKDFNLAYIKKQKGELPFRLHVFKIGNSDHSYRVNSAFPAVAVFMPAAIAVVGRKNGNIDIYRKNTGLMGLFFTGIVREVMKDQVPVELDKILEGAI